MSLNSAIANASNALQLFSLGLQISGNNIANAATPGYVRDELVVSTTSPYQVGGILVGSGAEANGVRQVLDRFLESRLHSANTDYAAADVRNQAYLQLQTAIGELGDHDLSTSLNNFIEALQAAANQPDDPATRSIVVKQGQLFAQDVNSLRTQVEELRQSYSDQMQALVDEANSLIQEIQALNPRIGRLEANGLYQSDAGALRVQRLNAVNRLSELMPVRVVEQPSGTIDVFTDSDFLILGGFSQQLETVVAPTESGIATINVRTTQTNAMLGPNGGQLGGLIAARDNILTGFLGQLDEFAGAVIFEVNKLHSSGEGLSGYKDVTSTNFVTETTAALNAAGLPFTPKHGSFDLKVVDPVTGIEEVTSIAIDLDGLGTDTSLEDLRSRINSIDHVSAEITVEGRLRITTENGYEVRFGNDTSGALAALGINTFFTGDSSDNIGVNQIVAKDQSFLATGRGGGPADNSNLVDLAQVIDRSVGSLNGMSIDQFYTFLVGNVGQAGAAEEALSEGSQSFRDSLLAQRQQRSGVSVDEEAIKMLQFQHNYQAAARVITTIDQLFDVLLNI